MKLINDMLRAQQDLLRIRNTYPVAFLLTTGDHIALRHLAQEHLTPYWRGNDAESFDGTPVYELANLMRSVMLMPDGSTRPLR